MKKPKPLVVIPCYVREDEDVKTTSEAVESIRKTAQGAVDVILVDDGSPEPALVDRLAEEAERFGADFHRKDDNTGFSKTVNVGLRRAITEGRDAILMNADVEIMTPQFAARMQRTVDDRGGMAAVVGALLIYPDGGLIQHAGIYFSLLTRSFDHINKYGPMNLPEALQPRNCPVTGALQFIRHETLMTVGLYDEEFFMGWEDVDYCLRVFQHDLRCVYNPNVRAWHAEMMFRGRPSAKVAEWQQKSWMRLSTKHAETNFQNLVPSF